MVGLTDEMRQRSAFGSHSHRVEGWVAVPGVMHPPPGVGLKRLAASYLDRERFRPSGTRSAAEKADLRAVECHLVNV